MAKKQKSPEESTPQLDSAAARLVKKLEATESL